MANQISVVLNTLNNEKEIERVVKSVSFAKEIIVCDMYSEDNTVNLAKKLGAKVFLCKREEFVEKARNLAVSKATGDWVLIVDPDEQIPASLAERLQEIVVSLEQIDYVKIPRKNIIFGKWMQASMWWPDYNIRFFKKGKVNWTNKIHRQPQVLGMGLDLPSEEKWAIVHNHYDSIVQFIEKMIRYTKVQSEELIKDGYQFDWKDLIKKPLSEFLSRYFANYGFKDGIHGLALSFLQAFSFLIVYLKVWESEGFKEKQIELKEVKELNKQSTFEINYWINNFSLSKNTFKRFFQKVKNKF